MTVTVAVTIMIAQAALCTDWHTAPTATQLIRSNLKHKPKLISLPVKVTGPVDLIRSSSRVSHRDQIMITY